MNNLSANSTQAEPTFFDLSDHLLNGETQFQTYWGNLGFWQSAENYADACRALAVLLADEVQLQNAPSLVDIGFGCGDQLLLWLDTYNVAAVFGLNLAKVQTDLACKRIADSRDEKAEDMSRIDLQTGDVSTLLSLWQASQHDPVARVLALDCAYHFTQRTEFFHHSYQILQQGGRLGLTDVVFNWDQQPKYKQWLLKTMLWLAKVPLDNCLDGDDYKSNLYAAGFSRVETRDISEFVFAPFLSWLHRYHKEYKVEVRQRFPKASWVKYFVTGRFLAWAHRQGLLKYYLIIAEK